MGTWTKKLYLHTQVKPYLVYYNYVSFIDLIDINECGKSWVRVTVGSNQKLINSCAKSTWYARRQHSYNICKDFLSHNSWMKKSKFRQQLHHKHELEHLYIRHMFWEISKDYQFQ